MKTEDRISQAFSTLGNTIKSAAKIALLSRRCGIKPHNPKEGDTLVILANGPSLRDTISNHASTLSRNPTLAVNFAANADSFKILKPRYYVLADPHFFVSDEPNVKQLWTNLACTSWPLTLFAPADRLDRARHLAPDMDIQCYNAVGAEGWRALCHAAFKNGRAMPRPRNVLIAAIMIAIKAGFKTIYLTGADHSWLRTLSVADDNCVISIQPHFYADDKRELNRSAAEYRGYRLHDVLNNFTIAFRSYHQIEEFARTQGVRIYNATPQSYIDAFERRLLE